MESHQEPESVPAHVPASPWRRLWVPVTFFLVTLAVYLPTTSSEIIGNDSRANGFTAWHLATHGSPFLDDVDVPRLKGPEYFGPNTDGRTVTARTPGQIWAAVPFYLFSSDDVEDLSYRPASIAGAVVTAAAMTLLMLALRRRLPTGGAVAATAVVAFATPVWSVSADALWPHCVTILGIAGCAYSLGRDRWFGAGLWLGLGILARPHLAIVAAVVGLGLALWRRSPRIALAVAGGSLVGIATLLVWNYYVFGIWSVTSGYPHGADYLVPGGRESRLGYSYPVAVAGFFISFDKGFLIWTPLVLLLLPLAWRHRRGLPDWSFALALGGVAYSLVQVALNEFTGGDGFDGYRLGLELLICLAPMLAFAAAYAGPGVRRVAPWVIGCQFAALAFTSTMRGLWVLEEDVWRDNSVLATVRDQPAAVGTMLLLLAFAGGVISRFVIERLYAQKIARTGYSVEVVDQPFGRTSA